MELYVMLHGGFRINEHMPTELLVFLYSDEEQPAEKRWAAVVALGGKDDELSFETLCVALRDPDWQLRRFALEGVKRHPRVSEATDVILGMMFDVDELVQQTAVKVAAELGLAQAHDGIVQLLETENPELRDAALNALVCLWRDDDFDRVLRVFEEDGARGVRLAAAKALRKCATPRTWKRLFQLWRDDREPRIRLWSCELVEHFGSRPDIVAVRPMLEDRNVNVRVAAQKALSELAA